MYLKILFLDSSAILSWFMKNQGGNVVAELHNGQVHFSCSLNISSTVKAEVLRKINIAYKNSPFSIKKYVAILDDLNLLPERQRDDVQLKMLYKDLRKKENSNDAKIISEFKSYLGFFAGESHPILVSCDNLMNEIVLKEGYRVFNPRKHK